VLCIQGRVQGIPVLRHILNCTGKGRKIAIPVGKPRGWTVDKRLEWNDRFGRIDTPSVFYKDNWVSRRLELKELRAVLDVPIVAESGSEIYAAILHFAGERGKGKGRTANWRHRASQREFRQNHWTDHWLLRRSS
jgi:hypothetical protein